MLLKVLLVCLSLFLLACNSSIDGGDKGIVNEKTGLSRSISTRETLVLNLEAVYSHKNDTPGIGVDTYKVSVDTAHSREYCLENDLGEGHRYTIEDSKGKLLLDITQGCATINLLTSVYTHKIYNGTAGEGKAHTVFITPKIPEGSLLGVSSSVIKKSRGAGARVFDSVLKQKSVISFNRCRGCNLENIDLSQSSFDEQYAGNNLSPRMNEAYFTKLNTNETEFFTAQNRDIDTYNVRALDLQESSLKNANLTLSIFRDANFDAVDFTDANLSKAVFINCSFRGATFDNVDMTRTIFIKPVFNKNSSLKPVIVSKPAVTRLFKNETSAYYYELPVAINSKNQLVVVAAGYTRALGNLPGQLNIVSPPTIVPNNFSGGYSVFVKGSNGYIYEWYVADRQRKLSYSPGRAGWKKVTGSNVCKSNPDASYLNFGGSSNANELSVVMACHDKRGTLYTWTRTFYNKYNKAGYSRYGDWVKNTYTIETTNKEISIDRYNTYFYQKAGKHFFGRNYKTGELLHRLATPSYTSFASRVDFKSDSNSFGAFIDNTGNIQTLQMLGIDSNTFKDLGSPASGLISSPAMGGIWVRNYPYNIVVLGSEGRVYKRDIYGANAWLAMGTSSEKASYTFTFINNNLTQTYISDANLSSLDLSSSNLTKTFFTKVNFKDTKFNNMSLNETVFDASSYFNGVEFRNSILKNIAFTNNRDQLYGDTNANNKNMISTDFNGSTIEGLILTNNIATCMKFDGVTFTDATIISKYNRFISSGGCSPTSFTKAINVPVEIVLQKPKESMALQPARYLAQHDFSSTSFSDTFYGLDFKNQDMSGARFGVVDISSPPVDFRAIDATGSSWANADLSFVKCNACTFDNTLLTNTKLYQSKLNNSSFVKSVWNNVNATYAQFQNATLDGISMPNSDIRNTSFNNSSLIQSDLSGLNLSGSSFDSSIFACSNLSGVNFSNSSFQSAFLNGTNFSNPISGNIGTANFNTANFSGVNFENVNFTDTVLSNAIFDFTGSKIIIDTKRQCSGSVKKPSTNSSTTCPDGNKPSTECSL